MPNGEFRRKLERLDRQPLGELVNIVDRADIDLDVDAVGLQKLVDVRNEAIHRGSEPDSFEAHLSVQAAVELLGRHGSWKRSGESPVYGDEWEILEPADRESGETD